MVTINEYEEYTSITYLDVMVLTVIIKDILINQLKKGRGETHACTHGKSDDLMIR